MSSTDDKENRQRLAELRATLESSKAKLDKFQREADEYTLKTGYDLLSTITRGEAKGLPFMSRHQPDRKWAAVKGTVYTWKVRLTTDHVRGLAKRIISLATSSKSIGEEADRIRDELLTDRSFVMNKVYHCISYLGTTVVTDEEHTDGRWCSQEEVPQDPDPTQDDELEEDRPGTDCLQTVLSVAQAIESF